MLEDGAAFALLWALVHCRRGVALVLYGATGGAGTASSLTMAPRISRGWC